MSNKLLIVYNTCGIKRESPDKYIKNIESILNQDIDNSRVVMSSCLNSDGVRNQVKNHFGDRISYNFIDDILPVNVTFNHSCIKAREEIGDFEGYTYVDSGITFTKIDDMSKLYNLFKKDDYGMVASRTSTDSGYSLWFDLGEGLWDTSQDYKLFEKGDFVIPVGKTVNLHVQIFAKKLFDYYGFLVPDIYAGYCTESVFSFLCAALKTKFVVSSDVIVDHLHQMDIGSSGFDPLSWQKMGGKSYEHPFKVKSVVELAKAGHEFGFGYEECENILMHDPSKFDENYFALDDRLKSYIKDNQFIQNLGVFNYSNINYSWAS
ncbi:MAG: hypothetical protein CL833_04955 [Crocinitomicaceae bacterium]|nr:hypothetical protein [Crocinitomicaceae bacterium]